jgi:hypothetical protein
MRGSPLIRALIALIILLALGFPLHRLLQATAAPEPAPAAAATPAPEKGAKVQLQVSFTTPPAESRLLSLGELVWKASAPSQSIEHELTLAFPKEGVDLQCEADWPASTRAAAQVKLTDPDGADHVKYLWGEGPTSDVLTFP